MADYLKGKQYVRYGGKDYLDKLYASAEIKTEIEVVKQIDLNEKKNYPYRCYCTQTFRFYHELKRHRSEAKHPAKVLDVPQEI